MIHRILVGYKDMVKPFSFMEQWTYPALLDIKLRYRRTILGPFWVTLSTLITISLLSLLWSKIFNQDIAKFIPYFSIGLIYWNWFLSLITECSNGFSSFAPIIKQMPINNVILILRVNFRQFLIFSHNIILLTLITILFVDFNINQFLFIPALMVNIIIFYLLSIVVIFLSTRYKDMQPIATNILQVLFFFTPIIWNKDMIGNNLILLHVNPVYHWLEILRSPLLGYPPPIDSWIFSFASIIFLLILSAYMTGRCSNRVIFWL